MCVCVCRLRNRVSLSLSRRPSEVEIDESAVLSLLPRYQTVLLHSCKTRLKFHYKFYGTVRFQVDSPRKLTPELRVLRGAAAPLYLGALLKQKERVKGRKWGVGEGGSKKKKTLSPISEIITSRIRANKICLAPKMRDHS